MDATRHIACEGVVLVGRLRDATGRTRASVVLRPHILVLRETHTTRRLGAQGRVLLLAVAGDESSWASARRAVDQGQLVRIPLTDRKRGTVPPATEGAAVVTSEFARQLLDAFATADTEPAGFGAASLLTDAERSVLQLIASGMPVEQAAHTLGQTADAATTYLLQAIERLHWRTQPDHPEAIGAGVPRRPRPGPLTTAAQAEPEPDLYQVHAPQPSEHRE